MEICDHGHEPICYNGINCPMCDLMGRLEVCGKDRDYFKEQLEKLADAVGNGCKVL